MGEQGSSGFWGMVLYGFPVIVEFADTSEEIRMSPQVFDTIRDHLVAQKPTFTREDVDDLRWARGRAHRLSHGASAAEDHAARAERLASLLARIAALLPPEDS